MKYIRLLGILFALIANTIVVHAQGFAGPDVSVLVRLGDSATITLGSGTGGSDFCYTWYIPEEYLVNGSSIHNPTVTIRIGEGEYDFRVMRLSLCNGKEEDNVHVSVKSRIDIVSVSPKYGCYNEGDYIFNEQFNIITDPPGYGHLALVRPTVASTDNPMVYFTILYHGHRSDDSCSINVMDDEFSPVWDHSLGFSFLDSQKSYNWLNGKCNELLHAIGSPCSLSFNVDLSLPIITKGQMCCDHAPYNAWRLTAGSISISGGTACEFPLVGIPIPKSLLKWIGTPYAYINLIGSLELGIQPGIYIPDPVDNVDCCDLNLTGDISVTLSGGLGVEAFKEAIKFEAGIAGTGGVTFTKSLCPTIDGHKRNPVLYFEIKFTGSAQIKSLLTYSFNYSIYKGKWVVDIF